MRILNILLLMIGLAVRGQAQSYQISLDIKDIKQAQVVYFGYWRTDTPYLIDSMKVDSLHPVAILKGSRTLDPGLYFFNISGQKLVLDFVVNNEPRLAFSTWLMAPIDSFRVDQSKENQPFLDWHRYKRSREDRIESLRSLIQRLSRSGNAKEAIRDQNTAIRKIREDIDANTRKQPIKYPDLLFAKIVACELVPEVPISIEPLGTDGQVNPAYLQYFRDHFWDSYDFEDTRLLNSPALARKTDDWLQIQTASLDSVKSSLALAMRKASVNLTSRKALTQLMLTRFDKPSYGGNETMLTYLFDQFMPTATRSGLDTATWMRVAYKANAYRPTLPGRIAPEIQLPDTAGVQQSLLNFKAKYTLLYFFSPLCAHCKVATPEVYELTKSLASKGIRVFAVTTEARDDYWKTYVSSTVPEWTCVIDQSEPSRVDNLYATHTLPNVMILDEQKKILVRRLPLEDLPKVLEGLIR